MKESSDTLVKTIKDEDKTLTRTKVEDGWKFVKRKMAYPYQLFKKVIDLEKQVTNFKKQSYYSTLPNETPHP